MRAAGGPPPPPRGRVPPPGAAPAPGEGVPSPRDPNHAKRSRAAPSQSPNRELAKPKERTLLIHALSSRFRRRRRVPRAARFGSTSIQFDGQGERTGGRAATQQTARSTSAAGGSGREATDPRAARARKRWAPGTRGEQRERERSVNCCSHFENKSLFAFHSQLPTPKNT